MCGGGGGEGKKTKRLNRSSKMITFPIIHYLNYFFFSIFFNTLGHLGDIFLCYILPNERKKKKAMSLSLYKEVGSLFGHSRRHTTATQHSGFRRGSL